MLLRFVFILHFPSSSIPAAEQVNADVSDNPNEGEVETNEVEVETKEVVADTQKPPALNLAVIPNCFLSEDQLNWVAFSLQVSEPVNIPHGSRNRSLPLFPFSLDTIQA